jgi:hypothetical protein
MVDEKVFQLNEQTEIRAFHSIPEEIFAHERFEHLVSRILEENHLSTEESLTEFLHQSVFLVNLDMVYSLFHLQNALLRSLYFQKYNLMKTKTFDNEVYYQLAFSTKINESVNRYSVNNEHKTSNIAIVRVFYGPETENADKKNHFTHELFQFFCAEFGTYEFNPTDVETVLLTADKKERILKQFKFSPQERQDPNPLEVIVTKIAIKDNL